MAHPEKYHGDRRVGVSYDVYNYQSNAEPLVLIGTWTPSDDLGFDVEWEALADIVYSTEDNSQPPDASPQRAISPQLLMCSCISMSHTMGVTWP